jgi:nuclear-control-of-ATPase protein 2
MSSNFAVHYIEHLVPLTRLQLPVQTKLTCENDALKSTHALLEGSLSEAAVQESINLLRGFVTQEGKSTGLRPDSEDLAFYNAVVRKTIFNLYALAVDLYLQESSAAQFDAEWWADIERSTWSVAWYLLQSTSNLTVHCALHAFLISGTSFPEH